MVWRLLARKCPNGRTLKSAAISGSLVVLAKTKIWRSWGSYFRLLLRRGTARGIEIVKRLQGLLLPEEFQPVSKQISGQHQHVYYCTPSLPSWSRPLYNWGEVFLFVRILAASFDTSLLFEENFSFCVNFGRLPWYWYVTTLLTSVKLGRASEDKLRDWDKRDMTYKHLYQFHSLTSDRIWW